MPTQSPDRDGDLDDVVRQELALLSSEHRRRPLDVVARLHPDFVEYGASGRVWDRAGIADALSAEEPSDVTAHDVVPVRLAEDVVLVTYRAECDGRSSLRSSVWVREGDAWLMRFHQGTPTAASTGTPGRP